MRETPEPINHDQGRDAAQNQYHDERLRLVPELNDVHALAD